MDDADKKGCLLANTAIEFPNHDEDVREVVSEALGCFSDFLTRMIKAGQERGDIPPQIRPADTARALVSLYVGMRTLSRGVCDAGDLLAIKSAGLRLISA